MSEKLQIRVHGDASLPTLVYLPGMHGDWTLVSSFRAAVAGKIRFVEFTYSHSVTDSLKDTTDAIEQALLANGIREGWLVGESFGSQPAWALIERFLKQTVTAEVSEPTPVPSREGNHSSHGSEVQLPSREGLGVGSSANVVGPSTCFHPLGLVVAGGFVRHPIIPAVRMAQRISGCLPMTAVKLFCVVYAQYAKFRHHRAPETLASIKEFVANRTTESDRRAITHRYGVIAGNDLRPVARATTIPVYYLAGAVDPLVPWPFVRWWLRRNCPGYRGGRTIWRADHNVLGTAPKVAGEQVLKWIGEEAHPAA